MHVRFSALSRLRSRFASRLATRSDAADVHAPRRVLVRASPSGEQSRESHRRARSVSSSNDVREERRGEGRTPTRFSLSSVLQEVKLPVVQASWHGRDSGAFAKGNARDRVPSGRGNAMHSSERAIRPSARPSSAATTTREGILVRGFSSRGRATRASFHFRPLPSTTTPRDRQSRERPRASSSGDRCTCRASKSSVALFLSPPAIALT